MRAAWLAQLIDERLPINFPQCPWRERESEIFARELTCEREGKETASEKPFQIEADSSSDSESEMAWFSQSEDDKNCPTEDEDDDDTDDWVEVMKPVTEPARRFENSGEMSVLFETPSGFAIFGYHRDGVLEPDAWKHIWADFVTISKRAVWRKEFLPFEDKSSAINKNTVSTEFANMIRKHTIDGQTLAVGEQDYANVIYQRMGLECVCTPSVKELIWGLTIQMRHLVPEENSELTNKDHFPISKGMKFLLNSHNFDVKKRMMVNKRFIETASVVYECDRCVEKYRTLFRQAAALLKKISSIRTRDWDLMKLAVTFKMLYKPEEKIIVPRWLFTKAELAKLKKAKPKYEDKLLKTPCLEAYNEIAAARKRRGEVAQLLVRLVKGVKKAYKAEQAGKASGHEIGLESEKICHATVD